jgi:hypothetical protein
MFFRRLCGHRNLDSPRKNGLLVAAAAVPEKRVCNWHSEQELTRHFENVTLSPSLSYWTQIKD